MQVDIPSINLKQSEEEVPFAYRTMEEIHLRTGGKPDVPHRHNYYTILWSKNACGTHYIDYREYPIEPNLVFFVTPGQVHQVITFNNPIGSVIMFTCDFLSRYDISKEFITNLGLFSEYSGTPPIKIDKQSHQVLLNYTDNIATIVKDKPDFMYDQLAAYLKLFLIECNKFAVQSKSEDEQTLQAGRLIMKNFKNILETKFSQWHKVLDYAKDLNVSADYLNNVIKASVGKTAKEMIQDRLVLEAKRLGLHTDLTSKEIAYRLGFDEPSHFSRFFKTAEKQSFTAFKENLEKSLAI